jgi:endonuclease G
MDPGGAAAFVWLALAAVSAAAQTPEQQCAEHIPWGAPSVADGVDGVIICRPDTYLLQHDDAVHVPRWVAYRLTAAATFGCVDRTDNFHRDELLPDTGAKPADYAGSGFDQGHMKPAQDSAWRLDVMQDSFSMANMAPQQPGLNREQWERLEETVRAWAWKAGELWIVVGPTTIPAHGRRLGETRVAVPGAFFKVVIDPKGKRALAFILPNHEIDKGVLAPWQVTIAAVEQQADIRVPLPAGTSRSAKPPLWPADLAGWKRLHKQKCPG